MSAHTTSLSAPMSRRTLLAGGAAAMGSAMLLRTPPASAAALPSGVLTGAATTSVNPTQFVSASQMYSWMDSLNDIGLRATGSTSQHNYVSALAERMAKVGIKDIRTDQVGFTQWSPKSWSLDVVDGSAAGPVDVAWYVPYSGSTGPLGNTAKLSTTPQAGTIGLATVALPSLPYALFDLVDYDTPLVPANPAGFDRLGTYQRAWLATGAVAEAVEKFHAAGAIGVVVILDLPKNAAKGMYGPYDGIVRGIPALFVDRAVGAALTKVADGGGSVRMKLDATVRQTTSPNVYGFIPGASSEIVMLQTHTDGTNGLEENGPEAILAMAQYLARIPKAQLPRTIMVVMSTGHMAGMALGTEAFLRRHKDDLVARTAAAMSMEHFGARSWQPNKDGVFTAGGSEVNIVFSSPHTKMVKVARKAQVDMATGTPSWVLRPYASDKDKESPNGRWWPGDGEGLWRISGLPSLQSIAGPSYLLNAGFDCMPLFDANLMRRQAIAFTNAALELSRTPWATLRAKRLEDPLFNVPLELVNLLLL